MTTHTQSLSPSGSHDLTPSGSATLSGAVRTTRWSSLPGGVPNGGGTSSVWSAGCRLGRADVPTLWAIRIGALPFTRKAQWRKMVPLDPLGP